MAETDKNHARRKSGEGKTACCSGKGAKVTVYLHRLEPKLNISERVFDLGFFFLYGTEYNRI